MVLTLSNKPAGLYFVLKYFSFTLTHLAYNDTIYVYSVPSMTL
jgi:hypothetical protein